MLLKLVHSECERCVCKRKMASSLSLRSFRTHIERAKKWWSQFVWTKRRRDTEPLCMLTRAIRSEIQSNHPAVHVWAKQELKSSQNGPIKEPVPIVSLLHTRLHVRYVPMIGSFPSALLRPLCTLCRAKEEMKRKKMLNQVLNETQSAFI